MGTDGAEEGNHSNLRLLSWEKPFHRAKMLNFAASQAKGKYLLFLDDDTKVISPKWIEEMLMYAQRDDVGAVGAKLYFPNNTIEHADFSSAPMEASAMFITGRHGETPVIWAG